MNKKQRQIVYEKFGGRCSYCGCDLSNTKWHVDHAKPVERKYKLIGYGLFLKGTDTPLTEKHFEGGAVPQYEHRKGKTVPDGFRNPENHTMENMMPACASCNINKHSMNVEEFRAFIGRFINSLNRDSVQYKIAKRYGLIQETENPVVFYFEKHRVENHVEQ